MVGTAIATVLWVGAAYYLLGTDVYEIPSESMQPTYDVGDRVAVNTRAYDGDDPEINDVVLFNPPVGAESGKECGVPRKAGQACPAATVERTEIRFLKRVVAGPGDTLRILDGHPVVNGEPASEDFIRKCSPGGECNLPQEITIPPDHYFTLGDNRGESDDSRFWGPIPQDWIIGKVVDSDLVDPWLGLSLVALLFLVVGLAAVVIAGMKGRWLFLVIGLFVFPVAVAGSLMDPRPGSYWSRRRQQADGEA